MIPSEQAIDAVCDLALDQARQMIAGTETPDLPAYREIVRERLCVAYAIDCPAIDGEGAPQDPTAHPCPARRWKACCPYPSVCRDKESCEDGAGSDELRAALRGCP